MLISIAGQHLSIGASLKEYVEERSNNVVKKYFENAVSLHIHFTKQGFEFICDLVLQEGTGRHMAICSNASSDEVYASFDIALSKLEGQLRKYKSKLKGRHNRIKLSENPTATKYIISPNRSDEEETSDEDNNPVIIAEKPVAIMKMSVSEAVMHLDLANVPALMFQNSKTGRTNVIYYRKDGNISWVDSN